MGLVKNRRTSSDSARSLAGTVARGAEHVSVRRSRNRSVATGSARSRRRRAQWREALVMDKGGMLWMDTSVSWCGWQVGVMVMVEGDGDGMR